MDTMSLLQYQPTLAVLAEELEQLGWKVRSNIQDENQTYRAVFPYYGQGQLQSDVLYFPDPGRSDFPADRFSCICTEAVHGDANHLFCTGGSREELLDALFGLFSRYQQEQRQIDELVFGSADLHETCQLSAQLLRNPVCIHDEWMMPVAMSWDMEQMVSAEDLPTAANGYVPAVFLENLRNDNDYLETYSHRSARVWTSANHMPNFLYVNLWDGNVFRGRLLVLQRGGSFSLADRKLAEFLAQRILFILRRRLPGEQRQLRSMDDAMLDMLRGQQNPEEQIRLLHMRGWKQDDRFLCIHIKDQRQDAEPVVQHALYSDLVHAFPEGYILFLENEQYLVINLTKEAGSDILIRHRLAPLCRDYYLYAGISSPVAGIRELHLAAFQADVALERAFRLGQEKWIIAFSDCAMEHMLSSLNSPLPFRCLIAPDFLTLIEHDRQKGTQYFETFREYILNERDIPKTAEKLIIHRTTLLYRLKKIQAMTNMDPEDPWKRLYYMLSLWFLDREQTSGQ